MSIKSVVLAAGLAATVLASAGAAYADPTVTRENREQHVFAAEENAMPLTGVAAALSAARLGTPSAFGTPGPYFVQEGPFSSSDAHWGAAHDADDN